MKLKYTIHRTKKGFIITSDEKPQIGDIVLETLLSGKRALFEIHTLNDINDNHLKVIAKEDQVNFSFHKK
jgi:hypothetical protein